MSQRTMDELMKRLAFLVQTYQRMGAMSQEMVQQEHQLLSDHLAECAPEAREWMETWIALQVADLHLRPPQAPQETLRELITVMSSHSRGLSEAPPALPGKQEPAESIPWLL